MFQRSDVRESECHQRWNFQRARLSNMAQRVAARIAVLFRIGQRSNPNAVEHDPDHAVKLGHESLLLAASAGTVACRDRSWESESSGWHAPGSARRAAFPLITGRAWLDPVSILFMAD